MITGEDSFANYSGFDGNPIAVNELKEHINLQHLKVFDSISEVEQYVCGKPVLNKIGIVSKTRAGVTSHRMILDTKASGLKHASHKSQRVLLRV